MELDIYSELYPEKNKEARSLKWKDLIKIYFWDGRKLLINWKKIATFFEAIWRKSLIKKFKIDDDYVFLPRPEEYKYLSREELNNEIKTIFEKNGYKNPLDLYISKVNDKVEWDFSPFKSTKDIIDILLGKKIKKERGLFWYDLKIINEIIEMLWWNTLEYEIKKIVASFEKQVQEAKTEKDYKKIWQMEFYSNKYWKITFVYIVKNYIWKASLLNLSKKTTAMFFDKLDKNS